VEGIPQPTDRQSRKRHSAEYIANIVKLVKVDHMAVSDVARQTGIRTNMIYRWVHKHELVEARKDPTSDAAKDAELARLQRENQHLKKQVDFLKKAAAYFAHENVNSTSAFEIASPETWK
jgi:transposase